MSGRAISSTLRGGTRKRPERGAVAVEFALVLPILAMLMMGIVTFGLAYNDHLALTNAIREASRFGATTLNDSNWDDAVVDRAQEVYMNGTRNLADGEICVQLLEHTGGAESCRVGRDQTVERHLSACGRNCPRYPRRRSGWRMHRPCLGVHTSEVEYRDCVVGRLTGRKVCLVL